MPLRLLLGVGEAPFFPAGVQSIEGWFRPEERGWPTGLLNASTMLGQAAAPLVLTELMLHAGWRAMFAVIGGLGLVLALAWFPLYRDAKTKPDCVCGSGALTADRDVRGVFSLKDWSGLFRSPVMWGMLLVFSVCNYPAGVLLAWLGGYLELAQHVSLARTGLLAVLPFLLAACGMFGSGLVADRLAAAGRDPLQSRKRIIVAGMVLSAGFTFLVAGAQTAVGAVLLIGAALFCVHFAGTAAWGLVQFAAPVGRVATVSSIQNFGSFMVASVAPLLTGWLLDRTHSFHLALLACSAVTLAGALAYAVLVRGVIVERAEEVKG